MTDEHLQKSAKSQLNSSINITPNDKYPKVNQNSGYSFKQDSTDDFIQHKHQTEQKPSQDQIDGGYYLPDSGNYKLAENPS